MLTAEPKSFWSHGYLLRVERGQEVAGFEHFGYASEGGSIHIGPRTLRVWRDGLWSGPWFVEEGKARFARVVKPSVSSNNIEILYAQESYRLRFASRWWRYTCVVFRGEEQIGAVEESRGVFSRKIDVKLPEHLRLEFRACVVWFALLILFRERLSSTS